ncbi:hypothetical protein [Streptomyces sp. BA2]|uniref:hypothetical protein n=1 Tax=Streptomyces sp. BA2 TaxID=436595 RepID=UPI001326574A|nr:hypothetical protein [Streptomyces sp. BA2]MWA08941.1 hypothetical protein [Streptomyces sp. BA2]
MRGAGPVVLVAVLLASLSGCGSVQEREDSASAAVLRFQESLRTTDTTRGCAALAPGTRDELEQNAELPCPRALSDAGLPEAGTADEARVVDVYGRQARVVTNRDTLFLSSFPGGWKVTAAGCTERPAMPYQCLIKGG